jgi:3-methyladenine DNA glycosylase AlkD
MRYLLLTPQLEMLISEIKSKIRLSMNGVVADTMTNAGIHYKKNYGVSIPRIIEIASAYTPSVELAQALWLLKIREAMIMAALLMPKDNCSVAISNQWVSQINQLELAEQLTMHLFSKLPQASELSANWVKSDKLWLRVTGFMTAARIYAQLKSSEIYQITGRAIQLSATDEVQLYKAIGLCLSRFCRKDNEIAAFILREISLFPTSTIKSQQYIAYEVTQELIFLANL